MVLNEFDYSGHAHIHMNMHVSAHCGNCPQVITTPTAGIRKGILLQKFCNNHTSAPQIRSTILALYKLVCMYVCMYVYFGLKLATELTDE